MLITGPASCHSPALASPPFPRGATCRQRVTSRPAIFRAHRGPRAQAQEPADETSSASNAASPSASTASPKSTSPSVKAAGTGFGKVPPPVAPKKDGNPKKSGGAPGPRTAAPPPVVRRPAPQQPLLGTQQGAESAAQAETAIVTTLGLIFAIILVEGIFLAASGFLPEEWDAFALDNIYPAFSPTVGLFLLLAAGYGLLKFLGTPQK